MSLIDNERGSPGNKCDILTAVYFLYLTFGGSKRFREKFLKL